jgi:predicted aspartyl protease
VPTFIEFPLGYKQTSFGSLPDPKVPVAVRTHRGWRMYRFLLDTGADFSLAPRRLAEEVGLLWDTLREARVVGIELGGITARLGHLPLRVGSVELSVRCLFIDAASAPFLLGRADFLERFVVTIDTEQDKIILREIP